MSEDIPVADYDDGFRHGQRELAEQLLHTVGPHMRKPSAQGFVLDLCRSIIDGSEPPELKIAKRYTPPPEPVPDTLAEPPKREAAVPTPVFGGEGAQEDHADDEHFDDPDPENAAPEGADAEEE